MSNLLDSIDFSEDPHEEGRPPSADEDVTLFADTISANLLCPIHKGLFASPVIARCGHTFCRSCLIQYVESGPQKNNECPLDKMLIRHEDLLNLIPNLVVADSIQTLKIYCKYGCKKMAGKWTRDPQGCQETINAGKRREHEDICPFSTAQCPYNKTCPPIRRMYLDDHVKTCSQIPCPHHEAGCSFVGAKDEISDHVSQCPYERIKGFIASSGKKIIKLEKKLKDKEASNVLMLHNISQLTSRVELLWDSLENKTARYESTIRNLTASLEHTQEKLVEACAEIEALKNRHKSQKNRIPDINNPIDLIPEHQAVNLNCKGTFTGHSGPVWGLALTDDGLLVSASSDTYIKIWDVANFKCKQTLMGHEGIVHAVVVNGRKLCSGSSDKTIRIWDLNTMQCEKIIKTNGDAVCALATSNGFLFSGSFMDIKVWDLQTYECVQTLTGHNHWVRALAAGDGKLYSGSYNVIKVWDIKTFPFQCIRTINGNHGSIYALAISREYKRLFSGTYENKINVYDTEGCKYLESLGGHIGAVYTLSVNANRLFSGSYDSTIKVWNMENFKPLQTLVRHTSSVDALVAHGGVIFSGSADHTVKVWSEPLS